MSNPDIEALRSALRDLLNPPGTLTRSAFDKLTNAAKSDFCRRGGKLTDANVETPRLAILNAAQFSKLSAKDKRDYITLGGLIRPDNTPAPTPRPSPVPKPEAIDFND